MLNKPQSLTWANIKERCYRIPGSSAKKLFEILDEKLGHDDTFELVLRESKHNNQSGVNAMSPPFKPYFTNRSGYEISTSSNDPNAPRITYHFEMEAGSQGGQFFIIYVNWEENARLCIILPQITNKENESLEWGEIRIDSTSLKDSIVTEMWSEVSPRKIRALDEDNQEEPSITLSQHTCTLKEWHDGQWNEVSCWTVPIAEILGAIRDEKWDKIHDGNLGVSNHQLVKEQSA